MAAIPRRNTAFPEIALALTKTKQEGLPGLHTVSSKEELREQLGEWRAAGDHIALIPTMGNLHAGHLSLIDLAREHAEKIVVSIFVNPTQFGAGEDFDGYPQTLDRDKRQLLRSGVDLVFVPDVATLYPFGIENSTSVTVPVLSSEFCGEFRPGHFEGVSSVVTRLFGLVQPDVAVFGQKDYQQQLIIRRMTLDLGFPVRIVTGETVREDDGLALSSRNQYLTDEERAIAPGIYRVLKKVGDSLQAGDRDYDELQDDATAELISAGFVPDYVRIRRAEDLAEPDRDSDELVVFVAATLGKARLIDNIVVGV
jgi:pantoate--beta-alanine ligase